MPHHLEDTASDLWEKRKALADENARLREALLALAPHHQGASSPAGKIIAEALGIPFPLRAPFE
jgi:hypothetical protein